MNIFTAFYKYIHLFVYTYSSFHLKLQCWPLAYYNWLASIAGLADTRCGWLYSTGRQVHVRSSFRMQNHVGQSRIAEENDRQLDRKSVKNIYHQSNLRTTPPETPGTYSRNRTTKKTPWVHWKVWKTDLYHYRERNFHVILRS